MCCKYQRVSPHSILKVAFMLRLLGTIGAVAAAAAYYGQARNKQKSELETVAAVELRKILLYAAPPTFLARVSSLDENPAPLRWMGKAAGN
jgi:hypothetical protein